MKEKQLYINIGFAIRRLRYNKGFRSAELFSDTHGLNKSTYMLHERGANMTISSLKRILDVHKMSLTEFFQTVK